MSRISIFSVVAALAAALATGCDEPTPGAGDNILFTPDDCGILLGCDFADTVGVGGAIHVRIAGVGDFDVSGVTLESSNSEVFTVAYLGMENGNRIWQLEGTGEGTARIIARKGEVQVDHLDVQVQEVTGLLMKSFLTELDEVPDVPGFDRYLLVKAEKITSLYVVPAAGDEQIMGRYDYLYEIVHTADAEEIPDYGTVAPEFAPHIDNPDALEDGQLTFTVPASMVGEEYRATFAPAFHEGEIAIKIGLGIIP